MSLGSDYDKLKRIGHLARISVEVSVWSDYDKLMRIEHDPALRIDSPRMTDELLGPRILWRV